LQIRRVQQPGQDRFFYSPGVIEPDDTGPSPAAIGPHEGLPHAEAPTGFVPIRWRGYLDDAIAAGDATAYRHHWELIVLLCLRDALRSGDVYVPGSRRYANPMAYLIPPEAWPARRAEFCRLVDVSADASAALDRKKVDLDEALGEVNEVLADGTSPIRLDDDGNLVIPRLPAEDIPAEAGELKDELTALVPFAPIASVFIELDRSTGFLDCFTHAGGAKPRSAELKRNLIAVLIALSTNLGLARTADACGIGYDTLAWTQEWYVREETLRAANLVLIDYHQQLPLTSAFGSGTLSSSDGQRFPTKGKSITARALSRYFADEGVSTYTHITDQHIVYGTKVIVATDREAACVLDEILGNQADLPITEHATDTHGVVAQLCPVRSLRATAVPPDPRSRQDHPLPHQPARRGVPDLPAGGAAADPADQHPAHHRELG
jgi:Tn3 transposase DDE domain